MKADHTVTCTS